MKVKVRLNWDERDKILRKTLLDSMQYNYDEIERLRKIDELEDYQKRDLADYTEFVKAAKLVYEWYSIDHRPLEKFKL